MKLATILIWSFLIVTLAGTLSVSYFGYFNSEKILQEQVSTNLLSSSQLIEKSINIFLSEQKNKVELIATRGELSNEELMEMTKIDPAFYDLFVIASNGTVVASSNVDRIGMDRANRSYFVNARNQTYVSPVYFALVPQQYSISVSTPFHGGVLVGSIKISSLSDLSSDRTGLGQTGESLMAFLNEKGETVYFTKRLFSDEVMQVVPFEKIPLPMQNAINGNEQLTLSTKDYRGVSVIAASNYIERIDIGMVTKIDYSEAIGDTREKLIRLSILIAGIAIVIVFIIGWIISLKVSRSIYKLRDGVDEITKGDLSIQLDKSGIFEIQGLIDSLNRILATMKLAILRTGLSKGDIGIGETVKAKEEAENKSQENEEIYKIIIDNSVSPIFMIDKDEKYVSANEALAKRVGRKTEEIIGKSIVEVFSKKAAEQISKNVKAVFNTAKSVIIREKIVVLGREEKIITRLSPVKDKEGNVSFVVGMVSDASEGKFK